MSNTPRKIKIDSKNKPYCPNCCSCVGVFNLRREQNNYCGNCGQWLDWSVFERKDCSNCKHIIICSIDKQAFYKITDEQCKEWERE